MYGVTYLNLPWMAEHLRDELRAKKPILIYAYNGTGKTRLSTAFKDLGKQINKDGEVTKRDTLYFNAFTEDLFTWDNDLENDRQRVLELNAESIFFNGLSELEMEVKIAKFLERYADYSFYINYDRRTQDRSDNTEKKLPPAVMFFRERDINGDPIAIKVSRGEENIFVWCFFLAIVQLVLDKAEAYKWVRYIYIDDPISSLDEGNAVMVAHHLAQMLKDPPEPLRVVVSSHHVLFFNVLCNEVGKSRKYFLTREPRGRGFTVQETDSTPFLYHLSSLVELHKAERSGALYTHHFNKMRRLMEQTASFFGYSKWEECIKPDTDDPNQTAAYKRVIDLMSHGDYSLYEAKEMMPENKEHLSRALRQFISKHPFSPVLFDSAP
ncbi:AAA family ATPase [Pseudomonas syringae]|uniref:AAA family ATPase n=1 Tax=Pseudomonas syringae TaxID=317 RepID=UPI0002A7B69B|nr:AAA family ATPase [Pseudomonas syringae]ELP97385.1 anticodon nuclease [Pseudomonas syringae BRIP34876]ELP99223.1 anticodon nuclease [Pseudomonas syringae BRIP34881]